MKKLNYLFVIFTLIVLLYSCRSSVNKVSESEDEDSAVVTIDTTKIEIDEKKDENGYTDIGNVEVWYYIYNKEGVETDMESDNFMLQVKSVNGDNFYYISKGEKKYLVERYRYCMEGDWTNAKADKYYFNNPAWPLNDDEPSPSPSEPSPTPSPQPRQLQPMSVWVPCPACHNSGQCQICYGQGWTYSASDRYYDGKAPCYSCGGSGKCTTCAGQGGHNEVQYR